MRLFDRVVATLGLSSTFHNTLITLNLSKDWELLVRKRSPKRLSRARPMRSWR